MILNNLAQQFVIYFDYNTIYPEVEEVWMPVIKKNAFPFLSMEDFIGSCIQAVDFPAFNANNISQNLGHYKVNKRTGFEMDAAMDKNITITFKLTESYISYFILRHQFDLYLKYYNVQELYWGPIKMALLDDTGLENIIYSFNQVTPTSISNISLSYAARVSQYNTFTMSFAYNYFDIWYRDVANASLQRIGTSLGSIASETNEQKQKSYTLKPINSL